MAMTSPSLQIPSFKISIAAMFVATLGFFSSTAEAVIVVTDSDKNPYKDEAMPQAVVHLHTTKQ